MQEPIIALVQAEQIELVWSRAVPFLEPVIDYSEGRLGLDEMENALLSGRNQLWIVVSNKEVIASFVTQIVVYPNDKTFRVVACGGSRMSDWLPEIISRFKRFAVFNDCRAIEMSGRPGWLRILDKYGFQERPYVTMELPLKD